MASFKIKCKDVFRSRGCFGCGSKTSITIVADEQSKRSKIQEQMVKKSSISGDFWSTSAGDMENSAIQSQRSMPSISINPPVELNGNSSGTSHPPEFVNHGLRLWNQMRQQWLRNKRSVDKTQVREPTISWNATYESLLGTNKPFPRPIPLAEMVDFLLDVWWIFFLMFGSRKACTTEKSYITFTIVCLSSCFLNSSSELNRVAFAY